MKVQATAKQPKAESSSGRRASMKVAFDRLAGTSEDGNATTTTWLTDPTIVQALGPFDLDPATPEEGMPWKTATRMLKPSDDGLAIEWPAEEFVLHNPPYGSGMDQWMERASDHGNGFTLIFARVETQFFFDSVWGHPNTSALFFFEGRLKFCRPDGVQGGCAGAPSVLIAYGMEARRRLIAAVRRGDIYGRIVILGEDQADTWMLGRRPRPDSSRQSSAIRIHSEAA